MNKINIETKNKWEESKKKINKLLKEKDISTITMMEFYKIYIDSPYNEVASTLFEMSFNSWYKKYMI